MGWLFVPGAADLKPRCTSSLQDIAPFVLSKGKLTPQPPLWSGWKKRKWARVLCGMTLPPSTLARGVDSWISSLRDTRASHSATPEKALEKMTQDISGLLSTGTFARLCPPLVFCENVAAHLTRGFDTVKGNLGRIGYTVAAGIFSAAEVGAPHLRERLFILGQLADRNSAWKPQPQGHFPEGRGWPGNSGINLANASGGTVQTGTEQPGRNTGADTHWGITRPDVADNQSLGRPQGWPEPAREQGRPCPTGNGSGMGDSNRIHCDRRSDIEGRAQERGTASCRASHVGHADNNAERAGLCPECSKGFRGGRHCDAGCHMGNADRTGLQVRPGNARATDDTFTGWPWPAGRGADQHGWEKPRLIKSGMGGTAYGVGARSEQLLVLGNGVVPVAGALAFVALWKELNGNG